MWSTLETLKTMLLWDILRFSLKRLFFTNKVHYVIGTFFIQKYGVLIQSIRHQLRHHFLDLKLILTWLVLTTILKTEKCLPNFPLHRLTIHSFISIVAKQPMSLFQLPEHPVWVQLVLLWFMSLAFKVLWNIAPCVGTYVLYKVLYIFRFEFLLIIK